MRVRKKAIIEVRFDDDGEMKISGRLKKNPGQRILFAFPEIPQSAENSGLAWSKFGFWFAYVSVMEDEGRYSFVCRVPEMAGKTTKLMVQAFDKAGTFEIEFDSSIKNLRSNDVLIYGSCVSRDAFERDDAPPISDYLARSSIVSAMSTAPSGLETADLSQNPSPFQRKMVQTDLRREAREKIKNSQSKLVLVDFIDERFNLARTDWYGPITLSPEFSATKTDVVNWDIIEPISCGYFDAFRAAWIEFLNVAQDKTIVINNVHWASCDDLNRPLPNQNLIELNNEKLDRLYGIVRSCSSVTWTNPPEGVLIANSAHRWGISPFHYVNEFEEYLIGKVWENLEPF